ncbi:hypothetical protein OU426_12535 [Frigidibacter sp. RF13]|uniref:hypothetical protein n=1 Tax=Frigidibacter sp. RF13 TaxID=2997340 RepID=UPI00226F70BC|nr:hypothetical protein [Frigidibacter sp. RF13]MCY1127683.1 hypothetical protein [Frigidibacter sp. RF13]
MFDRDEDYTQNSFFAARTSTLRACCTVVSVILGMAGTASGGSAPHHPSYDSVALIQRAAADDSTVALITGLLGIERDLLLGQLFLQGGMISAEGSHFTHPRRDNFPSIKDGLEEAGVPDLEPLLIALEAAGTQEEVNAAYLGVLGAVQKAKQTLKPSDEDVLSAVVRTAEDAATMLDPSGTTDLVAYQECWGLLMVARGQLDTLMRSSDPLTKKSAEKMALAFDEVVLDLPDPGAGAAVEIEPTTVLALIDTLKNESAMN